MKISNKKLKILILNWRDPSHPLAGGAEQSLHEHAKYWQRKGAKITWVASSFDNAKKEEVISGIRVLRFGNQYTVHLLFIFYWVFGKTHKDFDIIIDCFHFLPFFTPLYIKNIKKIALINEVADRLWFSNLPYPFALLGYKVEPLFFKFYKKIPFITASDSAKNDLLKMGIENKHVKIIPHGVILPKKLPDNKKEKNPTIIYCSRITKDKGIEDAIKAFINVKRKTKNLKFWIVGKEEKEGYLKELLDELSTSRQSLTTSIKYFGFVSEEKKFELLSRAWLLVHPSQKEGWGLNVIEANSVGTPAVGYNVEGLRDSIQDKKTGFLSDANPEDLVEKIMLLIKDKKMLNRMSDSAIKWSKEFSWEKSGEMSWRLISNL